MSKLKARKLSMRRMLPKIPASPDLFQQVNAKVLDTDSKKQGNRPFPPIAQSRINATNVKATRGIAKKFIPKVKIPLIAAVNESPATSQMDTLNKSILGADEVDMRYIVEGVDFSTPLNNTPNELKNIRIIDEEYTKDATERQVASFTNFEEVELMSRNIADLIATKTLELNIMQGNLPTHIPSFSPTEINATEMTLNEITELIQTPELIKIASCAVLELSVDESSIIAIDSPGVSIMPIDSSASPQSPSEHENVLLKPALSSETPKIVDDANSKFAYYIKLGVDLAEDACEFGKKKATWQRIRPTEISVDEMSASAKSEIPGNIAISLSSPEQANDMTLSGSRISLERHYSALQHRRKQNSKNSPQNQIESTIVDVPEKMSTNFGFNLTRNVKSLLNSNVQIPQFENIVVPEIIFTEEQSVKASKKVRPDSSFRSQYSNYELYQEVMAFKPPEFADESFREVKLQNPSKAELFAIKTGETNNIDSIPKMSLKASNSVLRESISTSGDFLDTLTFFKRGSELQPVKIVSSDQFTQISMPDLAALHDSAAAKLNSSNPVIKFGESGISYEALNDVKSAGSSIGLGKSSDFARSVLEIPATPRQLARDLREKSVDSLISATPSSTPKTSIHKATTSESEVNLSSPSSTTSDLSDNDSVKSEDEIDDPSINDFSDSTENLAVISAKSFALQREIDESIKIATAHILKMEDQETIDKSATDIFVPITANPVAKTKEVNSRRKENIMVSEINSKTSTPRELYHHQRLRIGKKMLFRSSRGSSGPPVMGLPLEDEFLTKKPKDLELQRIILIREAIQLNPNATRGIFLDAQITQANGYPTLNYSLNGWVVEEDGDAESILDFQSLSTAINLCKTDSMLLRKRGRLFFKIKNYLSALDDYNQAIMLGE